MEFALLGPLLLILVLAAVDFGRMFYEYVAVVSASRVAAEVAADNTKSDADVQYAAAQEAGPTLATQWSLATVVSGSHTPGENVVVTVTATFKPLTPGLSGLLGGDVQLHSVATARSYQPGPQ